MVRGAEDDSQGDVVRDGVGTGRNCAVRAVEAVISSRKTVIVTRKVTIKR